MRGILLFPVYCLWVAALPAMTGRLAMAASNRILITEIMALNDAGLRDEEGDFSDWIELHNPGSATLNLEGWSITDNPENPGKWLFPPVDLPAGGYLVVFASEKNRKEPGGNLHTNFKLSGSGEYLALLEPGLEVVSCAFSPFFPAQRKNVSYGLYEGKLVFFPEPTPGQANLPGTQPLAPLFHPPRGFYDAPLQVEIRSPQEGLAVYYTIDGTRPGKTNGRLVAGPVEIKGNSSLSAVVINGNQEASDIVTHTYLFAEKTMEQPAAPPGYPAQWSPLKFAAGNAPADYEMDPEVSNDPDYRGLLAESLTTFPTMVVVTNPGYIFSHSTHPDTGGIYIYTGNSGKGSLGVDWERPASVEYLDPAGNTGFQVNCGLMLHGGNSRVPENSQKHSFRLSFRSLYGPSKLNFNLFDDPGAVQSFNSLVLRAGYNYSWLKNDAGQRLRTDYIRDPFAKNTQLEMGHPSAHNKFVHLYLNGLYWGLYNLSEKITDDFMETYMGGAEEDWDVVKDHAGLVDGSRDAWNRLVARAGEGFSSLASYMKIQGLNPDGSPNPQYENLLDVDNLIDYMIYNLYIGNNDWDGNNWIAARNRRETLHGFRFFCWDAENSLLDPQKNYVNINNNGNPSMLYTKLRQNGEFRLRFADRLRKHFFDGGALTPEAVSARYSALAGEIDRAIIGESARWGDYRRDVMPSDAARLLYTRNGHWQPEVRNLLENYFPIRSAIVLNQFREAGLYPGLDAPVFSHCGGLIHSVVDLAMSAPPGNIYYTTDGSDPRKTGGLSASATARLYQTPLRVSGSGVVKARTENNGNWSALTSALFESSLPGDFILGGGMTASAGRITAYPNPFSECLFLDYFLPATGNVHATIAAPDGKTVALLFSGSQPQGFHRLTWIPPAGPNGLYLYRIVTGQGIFTGKILLHR